MMVSISNTTTFIFLFLAIFLAGIHLKCVVSSSPIVIVPTKVRVDITNRLTNRYLSVHCKDKNNDLGVHQINVGETYSFSFFPKYWFPSTLYFCNFAWLEGYYYFDIYVQYRDQYCNKFKCSWDIVATGPCKTSDRNRDCFPWNKPADGRILFVQQNNNTLSLPLPV